MVHPLCVRCDVNGISFRTTTKKKSHMKTLFAVKGSQLASGKNLSAFVTGSQTMWGTPQAGLSSVNTTRVGLQIYLHALTNVCVKHQTYTQARYVYIHLSRAPPSTYYTANIQTRNGCTAPFHTRTSIKCIIGSSKTVRP